MYLRVGGWGHSGLTADPFGGISGLGCGGEELRVQGLGIGRLGFRVLGWLAAKKAIRRLWQPPSLR